MKQKTWSCRWDEAGGGGRRLEPKWKTEAEAEAEAEAKPGWESEAAQLTGKQKKRKPGCKNTL